MTERDQNFIPINRREFMKLTFVSFGGGIFDKIPLRQISF
jgi:hypothetical protein